MGRAEAMAEAKKFKKILLAQGVPEVSIEIMQGRPASGDMWNNQFVVSDFAHHTVSRYGPNKTPCLALVKSGRSDVPGPLCNGYGGWDLCARIITLGYANHSGEGGPMTVPSGVAKPPSYVIPKDAARRYAFGWEFEGGLNEDDWSRELTNPRNGRKMNFHEFMARCLNGTQVMYDLPYGAHLEHSTWAPQRKIDRLHYNKERGIELMKKYRAPSGGGGDGSGGDATPHVTEAIHANVRYEKALKGINNPKVPEEKFIAEVEAQRKALREVQKG